MKTSLNFSERETQNKDKFCSSRGREIYTSHVGLCSVSAVEFGEQKWTILRSPSSARLWMPQVGSETRLPPGFSQCPLCLFSMGTQRKSPTGWLITLWGAVRRIRILLPKSRWKEDSQSSETNFYLRCPDVVGVTGVNTRKHQGTCANQLSRFWTPPCPGENLSRKF